MVAGVSPAWVPVSRRIRPPLQGNGYLPSVRRELLLLVGLLALTFARENLFPIPHLASGTNDPERSCDFGDESSKLL